MKLFKINIIIIFISIFFISCDSSYEFKDNEWYYVTWDEGQGERKKKLDVNNKMFKVLENEKYALDNNNVFYEGNIIREANPSSFAYIGNKGYSRDDKNVFLFQYKIPYSDPNTFEVLEFPYSKDKNNIFSGSIPLKIKKLNNFDLISYSGYSVSSKAEFIKFNPDYNFLDTLEIESIIEAFSRAKINEKLYEGHREVNTNNQ